ncbi:unnamed protein product, partial [marine sediment metagenome]
GALWFSQTLNFSLPVRIGDTITVIGEVVEKRKKDKSIKIKTDVYNGNSQVVISGVAQVRIIEEIMEEVKNNVTRVALVFGATGGIGSATCMELGELGFNVAVHYRDEPSEATRIKANIDKRSKSITIIADILNELDVVRVINAAITGFGRIDVVVNCMSTPLLNVKFLDVERDCFDKQMSMDLDTNINIAKGVIPHMLKNGYGKIIHIGSSLADKLNGELSTYVISKSALWGLTKSLSHEFAPKGIRVNMITPSLVNTSLTADFPEKSKLIMASQSQLRRNAYATEIAGAIGFLASDKSDYITGQNIRVNGGIYG